MADTNEKKVEEIVLDDTKVEKVEVKEEKKALTQDEIDIILKENVKLKQATSGLDKKVSELLNEKKAQSELEERKKKEAMTVQEKKDYELSEKMKLIDNYEQKILSSNFKDYAIQKLSEVGLNSSFSEFVMGNSNAEIELKVQKFKENLDKEKIGKQKEKINSNSYSVTNNKGIEDDLDKETLMRKEIDSLIGNGDNGKALQLQFKLKEIQKRQKKK